ncbi:MAG: Ni/Fe hydrogenase subunit alpha [Acidobacteria bacterium]|nr:MAG: Ni/Fe hydrogenase subunit alpha [Acidobacteriota bacterium]GIK78415.1 MAG: Ni/Fe hydrogenase subunit alpha [Actinomycetes bacterium]
MSTADGARRIETAALARVEGEGAMHVRIRGDEVLAVELRIYEPPRFFEALLRGRALEEAPDITARICGICPIAYQTSACQAMEDALGITVTGPLRDLRRLIYCGEWIESHALHLYLLHAPDFLGYESGFAMAADHRGIVERGLRAKKAGNRLIEVIGGRAVHPVNVRVGGFYRAPERRQLEALRPELERCRDEALATVRWCAGLDFPDLERDYELVCLRSQRAGEYPIDDGRIVSSKGIDVAPAGFDATFEERQVPHSTALHARVRERGSYLTGPMARFDLNRERLPPIAADAATEAGIGEGCSNPFRSIVVRAVEILFAFDEALRLIDRYERPDRPFVAYRTRAGIGHGVSEAPRGMLYHRYEIDDAGEIVAAWIVPPTSQNQRSIEEDLAEFVAANVRLPDDELRRRCEQTIRNYDPCISCSTHFLRLEVERE